MLICKTRLNHRQGFAMFTLLNDRKLISFNISMCSLLIALVNSIRPLPWLTRPSRFLSVNISGATEDYMSKILLLVVSNQTCNLSIVFGANEAYMWFVICSTILCEVGEKVFYKKKCFSVLTVGCSSKTTQKFDIQIAYVPQRTFCSAEMGLAERKSEYCL